MTYSSFLLSKNSRTASEKNSLLDMPILFAVCSAWTNKLSGIDIAVFIAKSITRVIPFVNRFGALLSDSKIEVS